jgi:hypothetical protein
VIIRLKGIWKTTGLSWKEQAKVKRKIIHPIGEFAKGWHHGKWPNELMEHLNSACQELKKYINQAMIAKKFLHTTNVPEHFHRIYGTDDDVRDTKPVMAYKAEPKQLTFATSGWLRLVKPCE